MSPAGRKPAPRPRRRASEPSRTKGSLRVVAGTARGRRLDAPPGEGTRPTSDRVREAIFNALTSLGVVDGARVLDAFAGSGALGIEAASRGAAHVTFADVDAGAREVIGTNLAATGFGDVAVVTAADGVALVARGPWDLVLLDPPYAMDRWPELVDALVAGLATGGVAVIEADHEVDLGPLLDAIRVRRYGGTVVTFASPTEATP